MVLEMKKVYVFGTILVKYSNKDLKVNKLVKFAVLLFTVIKITISKKV
jgi:hypothetical protein